jgi:hypothetical protein
VALRPGEVQRLDRLAAQMRCSAGEALGLALHLLAEFDAGERRRRVEARREQRKRERERGSAEAWT